MEHPRYKLNLLSEQIVLRWDPMVHVSVLVDTVKTANFVVTDVNVSFSFCALVCRSQERRVRRARVEGNCPTLQYFDPSPPPGKEGAYVVCYWLSISPLPTPFHHKRRGVGGVGVGI